MQLSTIEDVVEFLNAPNPDWKTIQLSKELFTIRIQVEGEEYHACLHGLMLESLYAYQDSLCRTYAMAKYGTENLPPYDRDPIRTWFKVEGDGCSLIEISNDLLAVFQLGLRSKSPEDLSVLLLYIAMLLAGGDLVDKTYSGLPVKIATAKEQAAQQPFTEALALLRERVKGIATNLKMAAEAADRLIQALHVQLIKDTVKATQIRIGECHFTGAEIRQIQEPGKPQPSQTTELRLTNATIIGLHLAESSKIEIVDVKDNTTGKVYRECRRMDESYLADEPDRRVEKALMNSLLLSTGLDVQLLIRTATDGSTRNFLADVLLAE